MSEWISVKDKKPPEDRWLLVVCYGSDIIRPEDGETLEEAVARTYRECARITLAANLGDEGWVEKDGFPLVVLPTYWMELPPIPPAPKFDFLKNVEEKKNV